MNKKIGSILIAIFICISSVFSFAACSGETGGDKAIDSIAVDTSRMKTEYYIGDLFDVAGGLLTVTYDDETTEQLALTAEGVEYTEPDMSKAGNKTITVSYGGQKARFSISVANQGFKMTFDLNYDGSDKVEVNVTKGETAEQIEDPVRQGYTFYKWYTDSACTVEYDFDTPVTADTTVYAAWKEEGAVYFEATYSLNYYGQVPASFTQIVKSGEKVQELPFTPSRAEYAFEGWYLDEAGTVEFTDAQITADTTIYAKWNKLKTEATQYIFEAENTDLKGKSGPGFSGIGQEEGMIVPNNTAEGGKAISFMYRNGNSLEFYIASDSSVQDATLTVSLAAELDNINFTSEEFQVIVNEEVLSYAQVNLPNDSTFQDSITITGVSLREGQNLIQLKVNNTKRPMGDASTYAATAPMIDCIKITTEAVLTWDANFGLPIVY